MRTEHLLGSRLLQAALLLITTALLCHLFLTRAWLGEDAHITVRTVDNFVNGHGLRWNVDERVQTYTHPLWMLVLTTVYYFTREIRFTLLVLCLVFSLGAYLVVASYWRSSWLVLLSCIFLPWALSPSFLLYGTSGFENPLTLFLLAVFAVTLLRSEQHEVPWFGLAFVAALGCVNRLDSAVIYAPAMSVLVVARWREVQWGRLVAGFSPLMLWLAFSLFYYGFLFPNTAYAKLPTSIPRGLYLQKGTRYMANFIAQDRVGGALCVLGCVAALLWLRRWLANRDDERSLRLVALGSGLLVSLLYVIWIGGDFLSGRFLVAPALVALVICASSAGALAAWLRGPAPWRRVALVVAVVLALAAVNRGAAALEAALPGRTIRQLSIARLMLQSDWTWRSSHGARIFHNAGMRARRQLENQGQEVQHIGTIGFAGLAAMDVRLVDRLAIADPLLARLEPEHTDRLRPGHIRRPIPVGYLEARTSGSLAGMDAALREYYRPLRLIVSGPLWSAERLATIVRFNLGFYDHHRDDYERRSPPAVPVRGPRELRQPGETSGGTG